MQSSRQTVIRDVANNIKKYRIVRGLSQADLAALLNYSSHCIISRIETGSVELTCSKLLEFAEALQVSPAMLLERNEKQEEAFQEDLRLMYFILKCDKPTKKEIERMIKYKPKDTEN